MEKILEIGMEGGSHRIFKEKLNNIEVFVYRTDEFIDLEEFPELADYTPPAPEKLATFEIAFKKVTDRFRYWPKLHFVFIKIEYQQHIENQFIEYLNNPRIHQNERVDCNLEKWEVFFGKEIKKVNNIWQTKIVAEPKERLY